MTARGVRLVSSRWTDHSCVKSALLSPVVQADGIWRVKIVWPNRAVHHFGKFISERDAIDLDQCLSSTDKARRYDGQTV
jgi:hypothetical protein